MSESSHPPTWPGQCTLESRPPTSSSASIKPASRSEIFGSRKGASLRALIYLHKGRRHKDRKLASIYKRVRAQAPHPLIPGPHNKAQKAARSQTRARARRGAQAEGVWVRGRKGQILLYTERGRGGVRFPPPIYTEHLHFYNSY